MEADGTTVVVEEENLTFFKILQEELRELRWGVLAVACFLTFGSYYIYDFPGSIGTGTGDTIQNYFKSKGVKYTESMNQYLYSVYSWPNTILSVVGGLLIDRFLGLRRAMLLFTLLVFCGSIVFFLGVRATSYPLLLTGRIIFGLGGESLSVSQSAFVARWFKGSRGMALAFGITISFSRVGSSFNFLFSPQIAERSGVVSAAGSGVAACGVSLAACAVLILADRYAVRTGYIAAERIDVEQLPSEDHESERMKLSDIVYLPFSYWLLCVICVFCYTAIFPFMGVGKNFFQVKYGYTPGMASQYLSSYQLTSAVASPLIGLAVDSVGRNTWWLILACSCFAGVHILFMATMIPAMVLMVAMGCFYSFLVSGLWPSIPWAVPDNVVGVAYGLMTSIQNIGLATFPMLVGAILDHHRPEDANGSDESLPTLAGFMWTEALFLFSAIMALLGSVVLLVEDLKGSCILSAASGERRRIIEALNERREDFEGVMPDIEETIEYFRDDNESLSGAALTDALPTEADHSLASTALKANH